MRLADVPGQAVEHNNVVFARGFLLKERLENAACDMKFMILEERPRHKNSSYGFDRFGVENICECSLHRNGAQISAEIKMNTAPAQETVLFEVFWTLRVFRTESKDDPNMEPNGQNSR